MNISEEINSFEFQLGVVEELLQNGWASLENGDLLTPQDSLKMVTEILNHLSNKVDDMENS